MEVTESTMALSELLSLEKYLGLNEPNTYTLEDGVPVLRRDGSTYTLEDGVPVLRRDGSAPPLVGLATVACHLVKENRRSELLGDSAEQRAVVHQWLEYRVTELNGARKEHVKKTQVLKDLNSYLLDKVYMAGNRFTLADILMYYGVHPLFAELTFSEKETHVNVARWLDHIQRLPGVRHHLPAVVVPKNIGPHV